MELNEVKMSIQEIFTECQKGNHSHATLIKSLMDIYKQASKTYFNTQFIYCLKNFMIIFKKEPMVERSMDFVAKFVSSLKVDQDQEEDEMHPFHAKIFLFLLQNHKARSKAVRFRTCQLLHLLLSNLGEEAFLEDDLFLRIIDCMMIRIRDINPMVRVHAILALVRLQEPTNKECQIIKAYLWMLSNDQNAEVRKTILTSIAVNVYTIKAVLERATDINDIVRKTVFIIISEKVHIKAMTISHRVKLLKSGINDKSKTVRDACVNVLLQQWLRIYNGNIIELLNCLDCEGYTEECQLILEELFKKSDPIDLVKDFTLINPQSLTIPIDKLNCDNAFYWRFLYEYLKKINTDDELLEKLLPSCTMFAKYFREFLFLYKEETDEQEILIKEYIIEQLLMIMQQLDLSDEAGRKVILQLVSELFVEDFNRTQVTVQLVSMFSKLYQNPDTCINSIAEIIADIRKPLVDNVHVIRPSKNDLDSELNKIIAEEMKRKIELEIGKIDFELIKLNDKLEEAVKQQNFEEAAEIKKQIDVIESDRNIKRSNLEEDKELIKLNVALVDNNLNNEDDGIQSQILEKADPATMIKCLSIISELLKEKRFVKLNSTLLSLIETLIKPSFLIPDEKVRNLAVRCLGLCCLRNKEKTIEYLSFLIQISLMDVEQVRVTTIQVIFDLFLLFGLPMFDKSSLDKKKLDKESDEINLNEVDDGVEKNEENESLTDGHENVSTKVLSMISDFLDSGNSELRTVCCEGFSKLLFSGRISSPSLLSRLLLIWYNPLTEDDIKLRQCIGTFLMMFAFHKRENQEMIYEAFLPILKALFEAPETSPLSRVKVGKVAELLLHLTNSRHLKPNRSVLDADSFTIHNELAIKLCNEILINPTELKAVKVYSLALSMLELSDNDESLLKNLKNFAQNMFEIVTDAYSLKLLNQFFNNISELLVKIRGFANTPGKNVQKDVEQKEEEDELEPDSSVEKDNDSISEVTSEKSGTSIKSSKSINIRKSDNSKRSTSGTSINKKQNIHGDITSITSKSGIKEETKINPINKHVTQPKRVNELKSSSKQQNSKQKSTALASVQSGMSNSAATSRVNLSRKAKHKAEMACKKIISSIDKVNSSESDSENDFIDSNKNSKRKNPIKDVKETIHYSSDDEMDVTLKNSNDGDINEKGQSIVISIIDQMKVTSNQTSAYKTNKDDIKSISDDTDFDESDIQNNTKKNVITIKRNNRSTKSLTNYEGPFGSDSDEINEDCLIEDVKSSSVESSSNCSRQNRKTEYNKESSQSSKDSSQHNKISQHNKGSSQCSKGSSQSSKGSSQSNKDSDKYNKDSDKSNKGSSSQDWID